jgi:signal peptidase I
MRLLSCASKVSSAVIVGGVLLLLLGMLLGSRMGWTTHVVVSGSMEPVLPVGSVIVTRLVEVAEIRPGDIITFALGRNLVTHRVVELVHKEGDTRPWFRTKGDANNQPDPELVASKTKYLPKTVAFVPIAGYFSMEIKRFGNNKGAFLACLVVTGLVLVALIYRDIIIAARRKPRLKGCLDQDPLNIETPPSSPRFRLSWLIGISGWPRDGAKSHQERYQGS